MKDLKRIKAFRKNLEENVNEFLLDIEIPEAIASIASYLVDEFKSDYEGSRFHKAKYRRIFSLLTLNLLYFYFSDPQKWILVRRNKNFYSIPKRYNPHQLSYDVFVSALDWMFSRGYLSQQVPQRKKNKNQRKATRIRAARKFVDVCENLIDLKNGIEGYSLKSIEVIKLKIKDGKDKKLIDYKDIDETISMRKNLEAINSFYLKQKFTMDGKPMFPPQLYRVFNADSFDKGGRFYGSEYLWAKREKRHSMTINGEKIREFDFKSIHLRLLYIREGIKPQEDDLYIVEGYSRKYRPYIKLLINIALNASKKKGALAGMRKKLRKKSKSKGDSDGISFEGKELGNLLDAILEKHHLLRKYFFSGVGLELQCIESRIAETVLLTANKSPSSVVLPVHDSFLTTNSFATQIIEIMDKAAVERVGEEISIEEKQLKRNER